MDSLLYDNIELQSTIENDSITERISKIFDYRFDGTVRETIQLPSFPKEFGIGLIVGSSGSGKSTILNRKFGNAEEIEWDNNRAIASHFANYEEATEKFGAVGLNSIPTWLKPYNVLSNGEKFRADMARRLKDNAVIDEFTSVVNREVAISCSCSISKYIKNKGLKNIVFCSCHDDIISYLQPDWIYNTDTHEFYSGRYLCKPKLNIEILPCGKQVWNMFRKYHYLSGELNSASRCYMAVYNDIIVGFLAVLSFPRGGLEHGFREHRLVIHPDYQGMGIGNKFSEAIGLAYLKAGCRYFAKTSNPRIGEHRDRSDLWRGTCKNHSSRNDYVKGDGTIGGNKAYRMNDEAMKFHAERVCYSHEFVGDGAKYEYTYKTQGDNKEIVGQISLFGGLI